MANDESPLPCPACLTDARLVNARPDWAANPDLWWRVECSDATCGMAGRWHYQQSLAVQSWNWLSGRGRIHHNSATLDTVISMLRSREQVGMGKYNCTVDRTDVTTEFWVRMALEEALDLSVYLTRLLRDMPKAVDNAEH